LGLAGVHYFKVKPPASDEEDDESQELFFLRSAPELLRLWQHGDGFYQGRGLPISPLNPKMLRGFEAEYVENEYLPVLAYFVRGKVRRVFPSTGYNIA